MIRKIVKAGNSSHTVSLPKSWIEKNHLEKGDHVIIQEADGILSIAPYEKKAAEEKEFMIDSSKPLVDIRRMITSAYMNNYSRILLQGSTTSEQRKLFSNFPALEIVEETDKHVLARDMLDAETVDVKVTLKRMDMMVRTMFASIKEGEQAKMEEQDGELNKLYFLLNKVLRRIVAGGVSSSLKAEEVFSVWLVLQSLEGIADGLKSKVKDLDGLEKLYRDAITAYHTNDTSLAHTVIERAKAQNAQSGDRFVQESITAIARTVINEATDEQH